MKKLQNNFTTVEQSKRLLEFGVPADSADCCLNGDSVIMLNGKTFQEDLDFAGLHLIEYPHYIPCWSVGRLIEIYEICFGGYFNSRYFGHTLMEDVLLKIEEQIDSINFSKLEK